MKPITHSPLPDITKESMVDSLRAEILRGTLKSGQALKQDEIAARFGVSKIPVREALVQLKAEGLVVFYPNRGAFVSELSAAEADEIYVMRMALETAILSRAIPNLTVAQLQCAAELLNAIDREENIARWGELNWEFHATLYSAAGLPRLMDTIQTLHTNIARYLVLYLAGMDYQNQSQREHRALLEACRHGEIEKATTILEEHLRSASTQLVAFLTEKNPDKSKEIRR
jgi:DNA-binding GntR family transcriptional regulator